MVAESKPASGTAVVVVDARLGEVLPAAAFPLLRDAADVFAAESVPEAARAALAPRGADRAPAPPAAAELVRRAAEAPVVLVTTDAAEPPAAELRAAGADVVGAPRPAGAELLAAVSVMDRLRSPGGCPWDGQQDHDSLRRYLVEETYELLDAIAQRDRAALREELGDVLLQVLFHARVAAEDAGDPFDIDEVAADLVAKLVSRHPNVFARDGEVLDPEAQHARWEELKQSEKQRESIVDGVALGQPAAALAAKIAQRAHRAGVPVEDLPAGDGAGGRMFALAARARVEGHDPEDELREVALRADRAIRRAEQRLREEGREPAQAGGAEWRAALSGSPERTAASRER
ncbi:MazG family protein [Salinifilum aidingensis]